MASSFGTKLHDYLKIRFRMDGCRKPPSQPASNEVWKDFKRQWIVLSVNLSPMDSHLIYCPKEEDWLMNRPSIPKLPLRKFNIVSNEVNAKRNKDNHLEIEFEHYSVILNFSSLTQKQQWYDELEKMRCRTFVDLVRCVQHPERESEYIMEISSDRIKFWHPQVQTVSFEWKLHSVRRAQYHNKSGKVEIEVGRATETGEGQFYFIGHEIKEMFYKLKENISLLSTAASVRKRGESLPKRSPPTPESFHLLIQQTDEESSGSTGNTGDGATAGDLVPLPLSSGETFPSTPPPLPSERRHNYESLQEAMKDDVNHYANARIDTYIPNRHPS